MSEFNAEAARMKFAAMATPASGVLDNFFGLVSRLLQGAYELIQDYGCNHRDAILREMKTVYDEAARRLDIPIIREPEETMLEQRVWLNYVAPAYNALADRLCGVMPEKK